MKNKKSYMNIENILSEGFFEKLFNFIIANPALKKSKTFQSKLKKVNKTIDDLEKSVNAELKTMNPKAKKLKFKQYTQKDFS